jgi:prolipoprotein diacylglyceryltransferase
MGGLKPNLAWYAVCILSGAMLCYFICDHRFYQEFAFLQQKEKY